MALRAFHSNPSIGGFGNESSSTTTTEDTAVPSSLLLGTPTTTTTSGNRKSTKVSVAPHQETTPTTTSNESGDALCQIVKELVDNAVDACETARKSRTVSTTTTTTATTATTATNVTTGSHTTLKNYRVKVEILPYNDTTLRVTVSDNGCGMKDIQACVNAFQSSKSGGGGGPTTATTAEPTAHNTTAGRYGIGLTLCLLHAQRLVPATYSCITSATQSATSFQRALYIVNTASDAVECHREEEVPKASKEESGTCVSVLVPGGTTANRAWTRLETYLSRFQLSSIQCSIEILAPTLSKLPIHIVRKRRPVDTSSSPREESSQQEEFAEGFETPEEGSSNEEDRDTRKASQKRFDPQRKDIFRAAQRYGYFRQPLKFQNVAHSEHPIRIPGKTSSTKESGVSPTLYLDIIISPHEEDSRSNEEASACLEFVRMVNSVPLLDGAEAFACGLVRAMDNRSVWGSFGLALGSATPDDGKDASWKQLFHIRDSDQLAPFFQSRNHQLWEAGQHDGQEESEDDEGGTKKRRRNAAKLMMPAKVRLGKVLVLVNIRAAPSMLPLPTLSKGRLPVNHVPINQALQLGLRDCLKSLQLTSPGLLLTPSQLRTVERDVRYIPLLANATSEILGRIMDRAKQKRLLAAVNQMIIEDQSQVNKTTRLSADLERADVTRAIERRIANLIHAKEVAKKQTKRRARTRKSYSVPHQEYCELGESEQESDTRSLSSACAPTDRIVTAPTADSQSLHDSSQASSASSIVQEEANSHIEVIQQENLFVDDDDDDEWW